MNNIFVIVLIFDFFAIPREYQQRVLFWAILGVIVLRGILIGLGATIGNQYQRVLYLFAGFLILTGIKMLFVADKEHKIEENVLIRFLKRRMHVTEEVHSQVFFVRKVHEVDNGPVNNAGSKSAMSGFLNYRSVLCRR